MMARWLTGICSALVALAPLQAQNVISARSGLVDYVEGDVLLGDQKIEAKFGNFPEVKEKAVLRTEEGRVEVLLNPGVFLRMGENSSFRMITNRLIDTRLDLLTGSAVVEAAELAKDTGLTIICKEASITLRKTGVYRFDANPAAIRVIAGEAAVVLGGKTIEVGSGKMLAFEGETAGLTAKFDKEASDPLNNWSRRRGEYISMANVSAAKSLHDNGYSLYSSVWRYNPYFGMMTYIPYRGMYMSPYGYRYWSPITVGRIFYQPPPNFGGGGGGFDSSSRGYAGMAQTSSGYSGAVAAAPSTYSAPAAAASSTAAAAAPAAAVGRSGGEGGGGRGR
jgi:hypothetical protein